MCVYKTNNKSILLYENNLYSKRNICQNTSLLLNNTIEMVNFNLQYVGNLAGVYR